MCVRVYVHACTCARAYRSYVHTHVTIHVWRTEDRLCDSVSPSTLWVSGIELRISGLAASSLSHRDILLFSNIHCKKG